MPRIRAMKVYAFDETQGISEGKRIEISRDPESDFLHAVSADYTIGFDPDRSELSASDIWHAWRAGFGVVSAGMLSGATECAHVDAVRCAHLFNGTAAPDVLRDPYGDEEWREWHYAHGTTCAACKSVNYGDDDACGNCLASLADGYPAGAGAEDLSELVKGYVTCATWTDLDRSPECDVCDKPLDYAYDSKTSAETWTCSEHGDRTEHAEYQISSGANRGSEPYEYGVDDLSPRLLAEIRSDCSDFLRSNLSDQKTIAERIGGFVDHPQAAGGIQLRPRDNTAFERIGHAFYLDAAGHGAGIEDHYDYSDADWTELLARVQSSAASWSPPNLYLTSEGTIDS